mmetsp:Transcript_9790/g.16275  ORF Transcript_9790/g.16275 Transcript_9790/m.16275 type:complete len:212 (+) Transcript_9790:111-746(+)|eukprot:CAMPEP_0119003766 /NCGR_PEP_ID=MMETSP1176-20130426/753_1 /TAXON_ID=265551 /ORGANISM="Synedropsis recta cf, Strain CCMP1620" /LENGTH=211 /DNA_ID=CAMNT_0006955391 /DNA_START=94 /DNA_END=729 /DNA_ORIENTATION=+
MLRLLRLLLVLLVLSCHASSIAASKEGEADDVPASEATPKKAEECNNPDDKPPLITKEELEKYNGKIKDEKIYLSILGDVYDVTKGAQYYAEGSGYHVFAGKDGAVPFISGKFDDEEAEKSTDVLKDGELFSLKGWVDFYRDEERYPFLGKLIGRYYDSEGNPTEEMDRIKQRWADYVPPVRKKRRKPKQADKSTVKDAQKTDTKNGAKGA